jgi:Tfp pilus assembly protein PilO
MTSFDAWRRQWWFWAVPAALLVLGVVGLLVYRSSFANRLERLEAVEKQARQELARLEASQAELLAFRIRFLAQQKAISEVYDTHFATEAERFTAVLREVRNLARQAGLDPSAFAYPEKDLLARDLQLRQINFGVVGTYEQLRSFVNTLELSQQFLTLEAVSLDVGSNTAAGNRGLAALSIRLSISTLFKKDPDGEIRVEMTQSVPAGEIASKTETEESETVPAGEEK